MNMNNMLNDTYYPDINDENFQSKIFKQREFHINTKLPRKIITEPDELMKYKKKICQPEVHRINPHQELPAKFINPNTPYKGLLLFHGVGTGKTAASIMVAEKFKKNVEKYGNKIVVLCPGPFFKENYKKDILKFTGNTYTSYIDSNFEQYKYDKNFELKNALNNIYKYYNFLTYNSFYKKVLGERIIEKDDSGQKIGYRKNDDGEFAREESSNNIDNLDNTLLIVDEAQHTVNNECSRALEKIIKDSKNLKIILLSATPMKNLGDDIIPLINYLRPPNDKIKREKVFTSDRSYEMTFIEGGEKYLAQMVRGYVSYLRGADPITFGKRIDNGTISSFLLFTKVINCEMSDFQKNAYNKIVDERTDGLNKKSEAVANMVFPFLSNDTIIGVSGNNYIQQVINQIKNNSDELNQKIGKLLGDSKNKNFITENNGKISGYFLNKKYLPIFSAKFSSAFNRIEERVIDKKGPGLIFVYSNLVKIGINVFQEILLENGYMEYDKNDPQGVNASPEHICYYCGKKKKEKHEEHTFSPSRFITMTGTNDDDQFVDDSTSIEKLDIIRNVFNSNQNKYGKYIKIILGSKVMNEGMTLENIIQINILDVYYNLGMIDQVLGRGLRYCKHFNLMTKDNLNPEVEINKFVISFGKSSKTLTTDEELYKKAEQKYLLIKKIERILIENAIDCPIHRNDNIFPEEKIYEDCLGPLQTRDENKMCPAVCGYGKCNFLCADKKLFDYYDKDKDTYKLIEKENLDYSTFDSTLAREEINRIKIILKDMYKIKDVYTLDEIIDSVRTEYINLFLEGKEKLFDEYFIFQGLDELIPLTENDFNNFKDIVYNRYDIPGYLIFRNKYYIFQPFKENENVPMYYRTNIENKINNPVDLNDYIKNYKKYILIKNETKNTILEYNFKDNIDYYESREENEIVGIIDKNNSYKNSYSEDVFKLRPKNKKKSKQRGTEIHTFKGMSCESYEKSKLEKICKKLDITLGSSEIKITICNKIKEKLLYLEKTSTGKNKLTYIIIPSNHPIYPFPYNLEDRKEYILKNLNSKKITIEKNAIYVITDDKNDINFLNKYNPDIKKNEFKISLL